MRMAKKIVTPDWYEIQNGILLGRKLSPFKKKLKYSLNSVLNLTSLGKGGGQTSPPPDFQNSSKKIISHRFRVIKV